MDQLKMLMTLLESDLQLTEELYVLLEKESTCLKERSFNDLVSIASDKEQLVQKIELNNVEKRACLAPYAIDEGQSNFQALLKAFGEERTNELQALNNTLEQKMGECRQQNAINSQVIASSLENNQKLLDILTGKTKESDLYNACGKLASSSKSNSHHQV